VGSGLRFSCFKKSNLYSSNFSLQKNPSSMKSRKTVYYVSEHFVYQVALTGGGCPCGHIADPPSQETTPPADHQSAGGVTS